MKRLELLLNVGLLLSGVLTAPAIAQSTNIETDMSLSSTGKAADLKVLPRLGAGYETLSRFEGFLPLLQTPSSRLTFLEGRIILDTEAHLGGNILLGNRFYSPQDKRIYGGYLAYDSRNTSRAASLTNWG